MDVSNTSFDLQGSLRQRSVDLAFVALSLALSWPYLTALEWSLAALLGTLLLVSIAPSTGRLQWLPQGVWYLSTAGHRQPLTWRTGSVLRPELIIWRYGRWPWQRLLIRPDSLAAGEFRLLLRQINCRFHS